MRSEEVRARSAAEETFGITTRGQLNKFGLSDDQIDDLLGTGGLWRHHALVYRWTGVPRSKEGDWLAAVWVRATVHCYPIAQHWSPAASAAYTSCDRRSPSLAPPCPV